MLTPVGFEKPPVVDMTLQVGMQRLKILRRKNALQTEAFAVLSYDCQEDPRQIFASVQQLLALVA